MSARQSTRKRREANPQSVFVDEFTQCRGLTQDELDDDLKLLKMAQFSNCTSKLKSCNSVSKQKRGVIRSLYDKKDIASDLAKQSNQLSVELSALKKHAEKLRHDVVYQQTQIRVHALQKEMLQQQFTLLERQNERQLHELTGYHEQCTMALTRTQNEIKHAVSNLQQDSTAQHQLQGALALICSLRQQLQTKADIIAIFKQKELGACSSSTTTPSNDGARENAQILQLSERFSHTEQQLHEQESMNHKLKLENAELSRQSSASKQSFQHLHREYQKCLSELTQCKHALIASRTRHDALQMQTDDMHDALTSETAHYKQMCAAYTAQQEQHQVLNASICAQYYRALLKQNGLRDGSRIVQQKYNELESKFMRLSQQQQQQQKPQPPNMDKNTHENGGGGNNSAHNNNGECLSQFDLENIVIEERHKRYRLKQQLQQEKQRYFERVIQFTDDLEVLYRKCEFALHENQKIKHDAKKKTFDLQRQNEKLRDNLKQSHSHLRVKQTEADSKHKEYQHQHQQTVQEINGSKLDLQKRVEVLKSVISDLSTALGDAHVQMLSFQKQVFEETGCAMPNDDQLVLASPDTVDCGGEMDVDMQLQLLQPPQKPAQAQSLPQLLLSQSHPRTPQLQAVPSYQTNPNEHHHHQAPSPRSSQISLPNATTTTSASTTTLHANNVKSLRKRTRGDEASISSQSAPQTPQSKRRKRTAAATNQEYSQSVGKTGTSGATATATAHPQQHPAQQQQQRGILLEDDDASSSSSSSEVSHGSHFTDDEVYVFQSELQEIHDDQRQFFGILTNTKTGTTLIPGDFIKITRRGHPDYAGKIEYMCLDKATQKKKVCVSVYQLASDIPLLSRCKVLGDAKPTMAFQEGRREHVQLMLSKKYQQFAHQPHNTKIYGVPRIHINKKVSLWFPKKNMNFKDIERKTSGRDVFFCRYRYDKHKKELNRIDGHMERPMDST